MTDPKQGSRFRIPGSFTFPFGYEITIRRGATDPDALGYFDDEQPEIVIDENLTRPAWRRFVFLHEMEHAFKEWLSWCYKHVPIENPDQPADEPAEENPHGDSQ